MSLAKSTCSPGRLERGGVIFLGMIRYIACRMNNIMESDRRLWQYKSRAVRQQDRFVVLTALSGRLLLRLVGGHFLIEIAFALATAAGPEPVYAKIFGNIVPVDLKVCDQAPFAKGLGDH